ncbi:GNAT family N-acetyltransferase [Virgibacillus halophilus]|uniref:GNAT family N-acetyltransferase n=1 Tax=Tigheibacillus halophilus TaxID=361280 RepID=UPI003628DC83
MIIAVTERLFLRPYEGADLKQLHRIFSDVETMRFYPAPFSLQQTKKWIDRNKERYLVDGVGLWAVCLKDTKQLIGDCGIVKQIVDGQEEMEIGYHIHKHHWSKGYATEAAKVCRQLGFERMKLSKLISIIDPLNVASIRVAEKIGFKKEKESDIFGKTHLIYARYRGS